jgi:cell division septum initiation protein DivIVA
MDRWLVTDIDEKNTQIKLLLDYLEEKIKSLMDENLDLEKEINFLKKENDNLKDEILRLK